VTRKLAPSEKIKVDGKLDEAAWQSAEWTFDMVDITRHENQQLNAIPNDLQARVKIRWDDDYFYVGAVLHESYITAKNTGHNDHAPYSPDNVSLQHFALCCSERSAGHPTPLAVHRILRYLSTLVGQPSTTWSTKCLLKMRHTT
jgi:hypothetical protein